MEPLMSKQFTYHYFNWNKAAVLINEFGRDIVKAEACVVRYDAMEKKEVRDGLLVIFENGNIKPKHPCDYAGLFTIAFKESKPTLILHLKNGDEVKYVCATRNGDMTAYWPQQAVEKLQCDD